MAAVVQGALRVQAEMVHERSGVAREWPRQALPPQRLLRLHEPRVEDEDVDHRAAAGGCRQLDRVQVAQMLHGLREREDGSRKRLRAVTAPVEPPGHSRDLRAALLQRLVDEHPTPNGLHAAALREVRERGEKAQYARPSHVRSEHGEVYVVIEHHALRAAAGRRPPKLVASKVEARHRTQNPGRRAHSSAGPLLEELVQDACDRRVRAGGDAACRSHLPNAATAARAKYGSHRRASRRASAPLEVASRFLTSSSAAAKPAAAPHVLPAAARPAAAPAALIWRAASIPSARLSVLPHAATWPSMGAPLESNGGARGAG